MHAPYSQLRALAIEHALSVDAQPDLIQTARDGITLHSQGRHSPAVEHIRGGDQHADQGVGGQHQALIHLQQPQLAGLREKRGEKEGAGNMLCVYKSVSWIFPFGDEKH
eukprot:921339-Pelagomonas_calceolata.AAC.9